MQSAYSWLGSRIHLVLEDDVADAYNRALQAFFDAQINHRQRTGTQWDPINEPLLIEWSEDDQKVYDNMSRLFNLMVEVNGGGLDITEEEITSDFLVKL